MKKFKGVKPLNKIKELVKEKQGQEVDTEPFDSGMDFVRFNWYIYSKKVEFNFGIIAFYPMNGNFYVYDGNGNQLATNRSEELDEEDWYKELLEMFYVEA